MATLILDIETVGDDFDALDETTQDALTSWVRKTAPNEEAAAMGIHNLREEMGFSPYTGQIVAIGVLDAEKSKAAVYYSCGAATADTPAESREIDEEREKYVVMTEEEMLRKFWDIAEKYTTFVTYNGRQFDVPYLMLRSFKYGIRPTKNLISNRYMNSQHYQAKHVDLQDQLSFYGALRRPAKLHLVTRLLGVASPKDQGVSGDDVAGLYKAGQYETIARYNARDLWATLEVYQRWQGTFQGL